MGPARTARYIAATLALIFVLSALAVMMTLPRTAAAATSPYRVLRIGITGLQVHNLNPNAMTLVMEYVLTFNVYSTLLTYDGNYKLKGDLAYSWNVASDNKTWTLNLVHGAYFTDPYNPNDRSHPVTADDVVFTYRLESNTTGSIWWSYTTNIASVYKIDDYTVRIVTKGPYAAMTSTLTGIPILPQYLWTGVRNPVTQLPTPDPVGSGAMYFDYANSSIINGPLILKRNPNYYSEQYYCVVSRPDEVRFIYSPTAGQMTTDFKTGSSQLDAIVDVDPLDYQRNLQDFGGFYKWSVDAGFVGEIAVNVMTPAIRSQFNQFRSGTNNQLLLNDTVRTAIAMSVDKSALVKFGLQGYGTVADTLVPDTNPWHVAIPSGDQYHFDPNGARRLLNDAGWAFDATGASNPAATPLYKANRQSPLTFRLYTPDTHPEWTTMVANMTRWLSQAGIQTMDDRGSFTPGYAVKSLPFMDNAWKTGDYDIWLWDWVFSPVSDPSTDVLQVETTSAIGTLSDNYWSSPGYDLLYNNSLTTVNSSARRQITDEMQKMIYDYHSYILPYYGWELYGATNRTDLGSGWEGWGNWTASPGLTPDSDLPNLWFQVYPHDQQPPVVQSFASVQGYATLTSAFTVVATDAENDIATYAWDFGDGSVTTTTSGFTTHVFTTPGTYKVSVRVSDGEWTTCASATATEAPYSGGQVNLPPTLRSFVASTTAATVNESVTFTLKASDPDGDSLYVTWTFGDGSGQKINFVSNATTDTKVNQTLAQTHTYASTGTYNATATLTDNQTSPGLSHQLTAWQLVTVSSPPPTGGGGPTTQTNPWINYGIPFVVVAIIVVALVATVMARRKRMRDEEAQHPGKESGPPPPPPP